jgi:hypothetical protein
MARLKLLHLYLFTGKKGGVFILPCKFAAITKPDDMHRVPRITSGTYSHSIQFLVAEITIDASEFSDQVTSHP